MAVDMFMKITGEAGVVEGESVDKKHAKEIDVLAWSWGMSQSGSTHSGPGGGSGKVNVQDLSFTKYVDKSTPTLMKMCCAGSHAPSAVLVVRKAGGKEPIEYITITMKQCIVSSVSTGGSGGEDRLTENVTLNFAEVHFTYNLQEANQAKGAAVPMGWNIAENIPA